MKTLARRTPHVLLVAAMSSSALVGAATGAGAAQACDPATADCDTTAKTPGTILESLGLFADKVTVLHERGATTPVAEPVVVLPMEEPAEPAAAADPVALAPEELCGGVSPWVLEALENLGARSDAIRAVQPRILAMLDVLYPKRACVSSAPDDVVTGPDLEAIVGSAIETEQPVELPAEVAAPTVETVVVEEAPAVVEDGIETAATAEVTTSAAEGGVNVEDTVAPEQMEVVGPTTAAAGDLPQTGGSGSALAVLGLAMVASGAAARFVARD